MRRPERYHGRQYFYVLDLGGVVKVGVSYSFGLRLREYYKRYPEMALALLLEFDSRAEAVELEDRVKRFFVDYIVKGEEYIGVAPGEVVGAVKTISYIIREEVALGILPIFYI